MYGEIAQSFHFIVGKAVVRRRWKPIERDMASKRLLSNCLPWSVVRHNGTPNLLIQWVRNASATAVAVMVDTGAHSNQRVARSMNVTTYCVSAVNWEQSVFEGFNGLKSVIERINRLLREALIVTDDFGFLAI